MHLNMMSLSGLCFLYLSILGVQAIRFRGICPAEYRKPWSYELGLNGPLFWGLTYPACYGSEQSPIAIRSEDAVPDENLAMLTFTNYDQTMESATIYNTGYTIEVYPEDGVNRTISVDGEEYSLVYFHFHWGDSCNRGSEHTIDHTRYAMEMHLVHRSANDQTAVVAIFFDEKEDGDNEELQIITEEFFTFAYKGNFSDLQRSINFTNLLPANPTSFYRYEGSLTTPPCTEGVIWSVVPDPVPVGTAQMKEFRRQLYSVKIDDARRSCRLVNNYRPLQPLNDREVTKSQ